VPIQPTGPGEQLDEPPSFASVAIGQTANETAQL
jgi:hypothetical protein